MYLCTDFDTHMNITTENEALAELIATGKTTDRRYRKLPASVINGFLKAYNTLRAVDRIEELYQHKGLHYERLKGNLSQYESVRCNIQYRLIFISRAADDTLIIKDIELIEISKHYGDN